jgi:phosphopantetheinyl transferase
LAETLGLGVRLALSLVRLADLQAALESGEFVPAERLAPAELDRWAGYRFPKRRLEWLGGRWAAKHAAASLWTETAPGDWQVESEPDGRPFFRQVRRHQPATELSISHSHGLAAALAVAGYPCGLDLQRAAETVLRVREKFCHQSEAELLDCSEKRPETAVESLTMLWAAKEALRKGLGGRHLTGFLTMRLQSLDRIADRAWLFTLAVSGGRESRHPVAVWWLADFAIALTVITED